MDIYSCPSLWFYLYNFTMKQKLLLCIIFLFGLGLWFSGLIVYKVLYYKPSKIQQDQPNKLQTIVQNQTFQTPFVEKAMEEISLTGFLFPREEDYGDFLFKYGEQNFSFLKQLQKQYRKQKNALLAVIEIVADVLLDVHVNFADRLLDTVLLIKCLNTDSLFVQIGLLLSWCILDEKRFFLEEMRSTFLQEIKLLAGIIQQ